MNKLLQTYLKECKEDSLYLKYKINKSKKRIKKIKKK